jgi:hypothetical protein
VVEFSAQRTHDSSEHHFSFTPSTSVIRVIVGSKFYLATLKNFPHAIRVVSIDAEGTFGAKVDAVPALAALTFDGWLVYVVSATLVVRRQAMNVVLFVTDSAFRAIFYGAVAPGAFT